MFLKAYSLTGIEPSLAHIKSYQFVCHTHLTYILKHNTDENV
jgi:hypothetical protein